MELSSEREERLGKAQRRTNLRGEPAGNNRVSSGEARRALDVQPAVHATHERCTRAPASSSSGPRVAPWPSPGES